MMFLFFFGFEFFSNVAADVLAEELLSISRAMIIPLGKTVSDALQVLVDRGTIEASRCLVGFPHPSGANGHRQRHFKEKQAEMKQRLGQWFGESVALTRI